ncbi:MAG: N-6 DNA methylase [Qipengyuania sp.]|uniref:N-6 DNA methylase n=1 Tax=Qipengyuania sp. TaxID=2004515 RepID=UPI0030025D68
MAETPLFAASDGPDGGRHELLLDGGLGSFAVSTDSDGIWDDGRARDWAFSSDVPHHIAINDSKVIVTRWDNPRPEAFSLNSVEQKLSDFYRYLIADRVQANRNVVDGLIDLFRTTRSSVAEAGAEDKDAMDAFLAVLTSRLADAGRDIAPWETLLPSTSLGSLIDQSQNLVTRLDLQTNLELAIRHAGSEIFQEAHFALVQASGSDLFGWHEPAKSERLSRGTSHFTPPALARIVIERTVAAIPDIGDREELVILDPACGSASFLYEAARTLRRLDFRGRVKLIGRDISPAAVSMAKFMLQFAKTDWQPLGGMEIDIQPADALAVDLPEADIVIMNPPFLSWSAMNKEQREGVTQTLGEAAGGRADLSMAFIAKAMTRLRTNGALGSVMPSSLLSLQAAQKWRSQLLDQAHLTSLSYLGEYGLFKHATVQVATIVLSKALQPAPQAMTLIAENESSATGDALRALRRNTCGSGDGWELFETPQQEFVDAANWKPLTPQTRLVISRLSGLGQLTRLGEMFDIKQGIRTGANKAFLLTPEQYARLSTPGKRFFRPAMTGDNLSEGLLREGDWVFYPHGSFALKTEGELQKSLKTYYADYLLPAKPKLLDRATIRRNKTRNWWELSEHRAWTLNSEGEPRIISKYFGAPGAFALDLDGRFAVVQGFAWFPSWEVSDSRTDEANDQEQALDDNLTLLILKAFTTLLNSATFHNLARHFSNHVGGGQIDLSPRYVEAIPVPAMHRLVSEPRFAKAIRALAELSDQAREEGPSERLWQAEASRLLVELYGHDILELP